MGDVDDFLASLEAEHNAPDEPTSTAAVRADQNAVLAHMRNDHIAVTVQK